MTKVIIGFIVGMVVGFVLFAITPLGNRYFFMKPGDDLTTIYKVDTWTGKAWFCAADSNIKKRGCIEITKRNYDPDY